MPRTWPGHDIDDVQGVRETWIVHIHNRPLCDWSGIFESAYRVQMTYRIGTYLSSEAALTMFEARRSGWGKRMEGRSAGAGVRGCGAKRWLICASVHIVSEVIKHRTCRLVADKSRIAERQQFCA